jgi:neopullulanase
VERLDYLQALGVNALYLNPIFSSAANHRYHTFDYMQVDPLLGGNEAFRALLDAAHARNMRVVIDGVFNHASRGFWPFHHILENGGNSPYLDWFFIHEWPLRPYQHDKENPHNYAAWWDIPALPKINTDNPGARAYILEVSRHWIEFGADGWRLDVPEEIDDPEFWQAFRQVVKGANPDAYITGEIWREAQSWLKGDMFDSVMNYLFSRAALGFFGGKNLPKGYKPGGFPLKSLNVAQFRDAVEHMLRIYDWEINCAQLNLIDSHDTGRTLWMVGEDEAALRLCTLFQMTMPGAPCIYYGDEIGMIGDHDPGCRGAFPWDQPESWNQDLLNFYKEAITLRHAHPALRTGSYQTLLAEKNVFAFGREGYGESVVVAMNNGKRPAKVTISLQGGSLAQGQPYQAIFGQGNYQPQAGALVDVAIPAQSGVVLAAV